MITLDGRPAGAAPTRKIAKRMARSWLRQIDEKQHRLAVDGIQWAKQTWPRLTEDQLIETVIKHVPGICRPAVLKALGGRQRRRAPCAVS